MSVGATIGRPLTDLSYAQNYPLWRTPMETVMPKRKAIRIPDYDYSQCNVYFLTLCVQERKTLFWTTKVCCGQNIPLSPAGKIARNCVAEISGRYESVTVEKYCIMPDHVHLLLSINATAAGRPMVAPTVSRVVQQFKGAVSKQIGRSIWQKSFYDHIIRNDADFLACWQYIENNPLKYEVITCF